MLFKLHLRVIARRCTSPTLIKGIPFHSDFVVAVDVLSLHMDAELWGPINPEIFYPLRLIELFLEFPQL